MKMEEFIEEELEYVIENEIENLKREQEVCAFDKENFKIQLEIETLNKKDKEDLVNKIVDDEQLSQTINETIKYYLYHR